MKVLIQNRKAKFKYEILQTYIAGIKLLGTEVKSLRDSKASIAESFCFFKDEELFIKNMHISEWSHGNLNNHEPYRERKLLLTKKELKKLKKKVEQKGLTLIPLNIHVSKTGYLKLKIGVAKGKKLHDKRKTIKDRDIKRDIERSLKQ